MLFSSFCSSSDIVILVVISCRYNAVVQGVGADGGFVVLFDGYGTQEEVGKDAVELRPATDEEGGYKGAGVCYDFDFLCGIFRPARHYCQTGTAVPFQRSQSVEFCMLAPDHSCAAVRMQLCRICDVGSLCCACLDV